MTDQSPLSRDACAIPRRWQPVPVRDGDRTRIDLVALPCEPWVTPAPRPVGHLTGDAAREQARVMAEARVLSVMAAEPEREWLASEIARLVGEASATAVAGLLVSLHAQHKVCRHQHGNHGDNAARWSLSVHSVLRRPKVQNGGDDFGDRIVRAMATDPGRAWLSTQIAERIGASPNQVGRRMMTLAAEGRVAASRSPGRTRLWTLVR